MTCCAHTFTRRQWMWSAAVTSAGAALAACSAGRGGETAAASPAAMSAVPADAAAETPAAKLLRDTVSVDVHTHGGATGITSKSAAERGSRARDAGGPLAVACLADVPDLPILGRNASTPSRRCARRRRGTVPLPSRAPGMDGRAGRRVTACAGRCTRRRSRAAHKAGEPAIVADVEGLDFLDGKLERLEEAHQRGIRHVQLVHYTPNDIGDFQTGAVTHAG